MEKAGERSGQPVKRGTMAHEHELYMLLTESAVQRRDTMDLRIHAARLEELAERDNHRLYLAIAQRAWGVAYRLDGEYSKAEERLNQALKLFSDLKTLWQAGRTLVELAELDLSRSDQEGARDHYSQAIKAFESMKALPEVERLRVALKAIG